ncbi:MAG: hypothetical protein Q4D38_10920 [Planctomycetia bacterium]|nr:hypothetical protein [Planctomycetia bacterium]
MTKYRSLFERGLAMESLEAREMMSVSAAQPIQEENLASDAAQVAQERGGSTQEVASLREANVVATTASVQNANAAQNALSATGTSATGTDGNRTNYGGNSFETGGIPGAIYVPGIPPGDAGGMAGGNGGGRLPLQIPGFQGYGNAYYLDINDQTLPRVIWLYAEYFRNQARVAPGLAYLARPEMNRSYENYSYFGVKLSPSVFSLVHPDMEDDERQGEILDQMQREKRSELMERHLQKDLEKTLDDMERTDLPLEILDRIFAFPSHDGDSDPTPEEPTTTPTTPEEPAPEVTPKVGPEATPETEPESPAERFDVPPKVERPKVRGGTAANSSERRED